MIPNEIWTSVFEHVDSQKDLAAVVRANRHFKALALRVLYRHVVWTDPLRFIRNHPFVLHNAPLVPLVRSLTLGISTFVSHFDRIEQISRARAYVNLSGDVIPIYRAYRESRALDDVSIPSPVDLLATDLVTDAMYKHAVSFATLRELAFVNMVLPDTFYSFIHGFPLLDKLSIENCTPPTYPQPTDRHPRDLPITELSITGVRGRRDQRELRALGEAQQLRVIRFDWTCYIYKLFAEPHIPVTVNNWTQGFVVVLPAAANTPPLNPLQPPAESPPQLFPPSQHSPVPSPHIHTIDVKFPTQKSWQSYVSEPHDQLINPFADFLTKCPRLTNLRIRNYLPWLRLSDTALPNLAYYQGPLTTTKAIVSGSRRPKHLTIRDPSGGLPALEKAFREIDPVGGSIELETLSVFIGWWDDEILYAVLHHFPTLRRLEIMYKEGDPSEETVLGMGAHFFGLMPRLWSVRVFKIKPHGVDDAENLNARGYPPRSLELSLDELMGVDGQSRSELEDAEIEEAPSSSIKQEHAQIEEEQMAPRELIHAWNRYCPALREVQLEAGYVWRRAGPGDVWTERATPVCRLRNAGFEEV